MKPPFGFFARQLWPSPLTLSIEHAIAELDRVMALVSTMQAKSADPSQPALFALLARFGLAEDVVRDVVGARLNLTSYAR